MAAKFSRVRESRRATTTSGVRRGFAAVALTAGIAGFAALGMAGLVSSPAGAAAPGNNGSVKIANVGDVNGVPDNNPHVGCTFTIEWWGFDADETASVSFVMQAPTTGGVTVSGNTSPHIVGGKGGSTLDHTEAYTLTPDPSIVPQPQQGYHVKVTVTTPHSKGNDTKSKTFWFAGCGTPTTPTSSTPTVCANPTATETVTQTVTTTVTANAVPRRAADPCVATVTATATQTVTVTPSQSQSQSQGIPGGDSPTLPVNTGATEGESVATPSQSATESPAPEKVVPTRIESGLVSVPTVTSQHTDRWPLLALSGLSALLGAIGLLPRRRTARRS